jgi:hypothetical protein
MTVSARCYINRHKPVWGVAYKVVNAIFWFQDDHCKESFENDIKLRDAILEGTDTTEFIERRDYLRDLPNSCEGLTLDELKAKLIELGIEKG